MIDEELVLKVERLRDSLSELKRDLKARHQSRERQVQADDLRDGAARLAEIWMVEIGPRDDVKDALGEAVFGDLSIQFQRLLRYSEHSTIRKKYDAAIAAILKDFRARVVVPLKQQRQHGMVAAQESPAPTVVSSADLRSAFVGHSFAPGDVPVVNAVIRLLKALGLDILTGEKPKADSVSKKVRRRIEACDGFVGLFTRRDRIADRDDWTTSAWIIDEKAYAFAKGKKLFLLRERGVESIGGLQGDYEYLEFDRSDLADLLIRIVETVRDDEADGYISPS